MSLSFRDASWSGCPVPGSPVPPWSGAWRLGSAPLILLILDTGYTGIRGKMSAMKLAHTMIRVKNLEETLKFYTGFLGLEETRRKAIGDEATLVFLADAEGSYFIELTYNHGVDEYELGNQFGHLAFHVEDLEEVIAQVEAAGWWYRRSKPAVGSNYIFVKDPNGYDIEILEAS